MDDYTLDALNSAALESYDRAAEAGPHEPAPVDLYGRCPTCDLDHYGPCEPGPDYFDAYTVEEES